MPRPPKCRRVCALPQRDCFGPLGQEAAPCRIFMTLDEYECIRLIDLLSYTQEDCAAQMGVARTTVQAVYASARQKLADALVNGKQLLIQGGNYELCANSQGCNKSCGHHCPRRRCGQ